MPMPPPSTVLKTSDYNFEKPSYAATVVAYNNKTFLDDLHRLSLLNETTRTQTVVVDNDQTVPLQQEQQHSVIITGATSFRPAKVMDLVEKVVAPGNIAAVGSVAGGDTYQSAWKISSNDYEALELNACALVNLNNAFSAAFTDIFDEVGGNGGCGTGTGTGNQLQQQQHAIKEKSTAELSLNNNELISRSAKITQELEVKLRERRRLLESVCGGMQQQKLDEEDEGVMDEKKEKTYNNCLSLGSSASR